MTQTPATKIKPRNATAKTMRSIAHGALVAAGLASSVVALGVGPAIAMDLAQDDHCSTDGGYVEVSWGASKTPDLDPENVSVWAKDLSTPDGTWHEVPRQSRTTPDGWGVGQKRSDIPEGEKSVVGEAVRTSPIFNNVAERLSPDFRAENERRAAEYARVSEKALAAIRKDPTDRGGDLERAMEETPLVGYEVSMPKDALGTTSSEASIEVREGSNVIAHTDYHMARPVLTCKTTL